MYLKNQLFLINRTGRSSYFINFLKLINICPREHISVGMDNAYPGFKPQPPTKKLINI